MPTLRTHTEDATRAAACVLADLVVPGDVVLLSGDLGAGKTAFVKGLAAGIGVTEPVTSPTFNILLVHEGRIPLYHVDLYRLDHADQLEDIDYFGTIEADGVTAVEWGDRFSEARPVDALDVRIAIEGDSDRRIEVEGIGERGSALARRWVEACAHQPGVEVGR